MTDKIQFRPRQDPSAALGTDCKSPGRRAPATSSHSLGPICHLVAAKNRLERNDRHRLAVPQSKPFSLPAGGGIALRPPTPPYAMPRTCNVRFPPSPPVDTSRPSFDADPMPALTPSAADPIPEGFPRGRAASASPLSRRDIV